MHTVAFRSNADDYSKSLSDLTRGEEINKVAKSLLNSMEAMEGIELDDAERAVVEEALKASRGALTRQFEGEPDLQLAPVIVAVCKKAASMVSMGTELRSALAAYDIVLEGLAELATWNALGETVEERVRASALRDGGTQGSLDKLYRHAKQAQDLQKALGRGGSNDVDELSSHLLAIESAFMLARDQCIADLKAALQARACELSALAGGGDDGSLWKQGLDDDSELEAVLATAAEVLFQRDPNELQKRIKGASRTQHELAKFCTRYGIAAAVDEEAAEKIKLGWQTFFEGKFLSILSDGSITANPATLKAEVEATMRKMFVEKVPTKSLLQPLWRKVKEVTAVK